VIVGAVESIVYVLTSNVQLALQALNDLALNVAVVGNTIGAVYCVELVVGIAPLVVYLIVP